MNNLREKSLKSESKSLKKDRVTQSLSDTIKDSNYHWISPVYAVSLVGAHEKFHETILYMDFHKKGLIRFYSRHYRFSECV